MTALEIVFESIPGETLMRPISGNVIGVNFARAGAFVCHLVGFFPAKRGSGKARL